MGAAKSGIVDLSSIAESIRRQDEGIVVDILGLDGKTPLGLGIRVAGPDSARAIEAQEELSDELIARQDTDRPKSKEITERGAKYLAKITLGWDQVIRIDGEDRAFSEENALLLYTRFRFIREQVDRASGNRARFTKG